MQIQKMNINIVQREIEQHWKYSKINSATSSALNVKYSTTLNATTVNSAAFK